MVTAAETAIPHGVGHISSVGGRLEIQGPGVLPSPSFSQKCVIFGKALVSLFPHATVHPCFVEVILTLSDTNLPALSPDTVDPFGEFEPPIPWYTEGA